MPISVLLIDGDCAHAQAVVGALVDPWLDWTVEVAPSLAHARPVLSRQQTDVVLTVRRVVDGTAFDVLELLDNVPALLIVPEGEEAQAAHAMRHGFCDFLVQTPQRDHLLALPAQIQAVLERSTGARARQSAEAVLARQHRLLQAITQAQAIFIAGSSPRAAFDAVLQELMALTGSAFGLVGQVQHKPEGQPFLRVHAMTDISWDAASRAHYAQHAQEGMVFDNLHTLLGAVLLTGEPVISNDPGTDQRSTGVPPGHPALESYLGLPIHAAGRLSPWSGWPTARAVTRRQMCNFCSRCSTRWGIWSWPAGPSWRAAKSSPSWRAPVRCWPKKPVRWKARWPAFPRASPAWMPQGTSVSTTGVI
jgi:DNA-binding response OmpR family regulator